MREDVPGGDSIIEDASGLHQWTNGEDVPGKDSITKGLVHIYCGDGKGKTSAGIGLCVRAAGYGMKVMIWQLMKDNTSSERRLLESCEGIFLVEGREHEIFSFRMTQEEKQESRVYYRDMFDRVTERAVREDFDVLMLDEVIYCIGAGLLEERRVIDFLRNRPEKMEVILTGQEPGEALISCADYVSRICKVRHPFDRGVTARDGIER